MLRKPNCDAPLAPIAPRTVGPELLAHGQPPAGADSDDDGGEGDARGGADSPGLERCQPPDRPRARDAERDAGPGVELERVAGRLRRERGAAELEGGHDAPEHQGPADRELEPLRDAAAELRDEDKADEDDDGEEDVGAAAFRAAGGREAEHGADEPDAIPPERQETTQDADAKDARPPPDCGPAERRACREEPDEHARRQYPCSARPRDGSRRDVQSRGSERVAGRGHEAIRRRNIVDELADDRDEPREERRVEPLEREAEIPEGIPREIREVIDDETRVRDVRRLDASAVARELSAEKRSDEERLEREQPDRDGKIHRERSTRCGSDAPSMG